MFKRIGRRNGSWLAMVGVVGVAACGGETVVAPDQVPSGSEAVLARSEGAAMRGGELGNCDSLRVPAGNHHSITLFGKGYQIYRWDGNAWTFVEPSARLYAGAGSRGLVGTHYAGPTWESVSGSKVIGSVARKCPSPGGAIPWLLLSAVSTEGHGIFHGVSFIQRLHTVGGLAPSQPGTTIGELAQIPYTADYLFYRGR